MISLSKTMISSEASPIPHLCPDDAAAPGNDKHGEPLHCWRRAEDPGPGSLTKGERSGAGWESPFLWGKPLGKPWENHGNHNFYGENQENHGKMEVYPLVNLT